VYWAEVEPGDLVRWKDQVWLVRKVEHGLATAIVESADRSTAVLPSDADKTGECLVWQRPALDWPSAPLPFRGTRLVGVRRVQTDLVRLVDWVKLDDFQIGGALYLNPMLDLQYGERLIVIYCGLRAREVQLPVEIPRNFLPLPRKQAALQPEPVVVAKVSSTLFARLKDPE
jgi:hypothetical protein